MFLTILIGLLVFGGTKIEVQSIQELKSALSWVSPGDTIELACGEYRFKRFQIKAYGEIDLPIVILASKSCDVIFDGSISMVGRYLHLNGITFKDVENSSIIYLRNFQYGSVANCTFESCGIINQSGGIIVIGKKSSHNLLRNNSFINNKNRCIRFSLPIEESTHNSIVYNLFQNSYSSERNNSEMIQLNSTHDFDTVRLYTRVDSNYFADYNGDHSEVISVKSSNNYISNNFFRNCKGDITLRRGSDNIISGNILVQSGGIRVYGSDHKIEKNVIFRARKYGIEMGYGDKDHVLYSAASNVSCRNNIIAYPSQSALSFGANRNAHDGHTEPVNRLHISRNLFILTGNEAIYKDSTTQYILDNSKNNVFSIEKFDLNSDFRLDEAGELSDFISEAIINMVNSAERSILERVGAKKK